MVVVFIFGRCFEATFEVAIFIFLESPKSSLVIELGRTRTFVTFVKSRSDLAIFPFPSLVLWPFILVALFLLITRLIGYLIITLYPILSYKPSDRYDYFSYRSWLLDRLLFGFKLEVSSSELLSSSLIAWRISDVDCACPIIVRLDKCRFARCPDMWGCW